MLFSAPSLLVGLAALAALVDPAHASRIRWRHAALGAQSRRWLVNCNGSPDGSVSRIGHPFSLSGDYSKYCSSDWAVVKDELAQIRDGGPAGNKLCFDATLEPGNGVLPHLWTCYDGLSQQEWVFHSNGMVELGCSGLCLDLKDGFNGDGAQTAVQLWECTPGNRNQEWDLITQEQLSSGQY